MDKIKELLASWLGKEEADCEDLSCFSDEELAQAATKATEAFSVAYEAKQVKEATEAKDAAVAIKAEQASRIEAANELSTLNKEMEELAAEPEPEATPAPEAAPDGGEGEGEEGEGEADPEPEPEKVEAETPAEVVAAAPPAPKPKPVPASSPQPAPSGPQVEILAGADIDQHSPGQTMTVAELGQAFVNKAQAITGSRSGGKSRVATLRISHPEDRRVSEMNSADLNSALINKVVAQGQQETAETLRKIVAAGRDEEQITELTAAGGCCAIPNVRYEICAPSDDSRGLRDSLVRFGATRGGIQFISPPSLSDIPVPEPIDCDQDATGYDYPIDCPRVECGEPVTVQVEKLPLCLEVGNYQNLFYPELFRAWWGLAQAQHARAAETLLWDRMCALSTARTANDRGLGAMRNTLTEIGRYVQQFRYLFRLPNAPLRLWMPEWAKEVLRSDLTNQAPGDSTISVSDAQITRWFAERGVAVTYMFDGQDPNSGDTAFPSTMKAILALEGTFLFLDGGELNFGTDIRDWTQIRSNDVGAFMETFENVARVCNGPQCITLDICDNGLSSAPTATVPTC